MTEHKIEPLVFLEPMDVDEPIACSTPKPMLTRQFAYLGDRPLWQLETDRSEQRVDDINTRFDCRKVILKVEPPECTSNGVCSECELLRQIEAAYQSEKSKCTQQYITRKTPSACDKDVQGNIDFI